MGDEAIGMRELPAREGVGREALMDQRKRRLGPRVDQVAIERADLRCEQQSLVDERPGREGRDIEFGKTRKLALLGQLEQAGSGSACGLSAFCARTHPDRLPSDPRATIAWRITGIDSRTAVPSPAVSTGTSRQPSRTCPSISMNRSSRAVAASRLSCVLGEEAHGNRVIACLGQ